MMMHSSSTVSFISVSLLVLVATSTSGFVPMTPSGGAKQQPLFRRGIQELYSSSTPNHPSSSSDQPLPQPPRIMEPISYAEGSRKNRRTIYTHDDWIKHRSPDRFFRSLRAIVDSGVYYKNFSKEVGVTTIIATMVVIWNALTNGYDNLAGEHMPGILHHLPMMALPLPPFTLSIPSLGLLLGKYPLLCILVACLHACVLSMINIYLIPSSRYVNPFLLLLSVFKTNTSYERYVEDPKLALSVPAKPVSHNQSYAQVG